MCDTWFLGPVHCDMNYAMKFEVESDMQLLQAIMSDIAHETTTSSRHS